MKNSDLHSNLYSWFQQNKRDFPWREDLSPYRVWVSEVMLQQTQTTVVVPYFQKWMKHFPTISALAKADISEIIKLWEGLGYYQRARNLHAGASQVMEEFGGTIPTKPDDLEKIKGLGPYTVSAILAFAYGKKVAAVDGNVKRVLSRFFLIEDDISLPRTTKEITTRAGLLVEESPFPITEALIELGATVCQKKAQCEMCPIQSHCLAFAYDRQHDLPHKPKKIKYIDLKRAVYLLENDGRLLLKYNREGLMKDLYEFPYIDFSKSPDPLAYFQRLKTIGHLKEKLPKVKQCFTKYRVTLEPFHLICEGCNISEEFSWVPREKLNELPFSSGHKKVLRMLLGKKE